MTVRKIDMATSNNIETSNSSNIEKCDPGKKNKGTGKLQVVQKVIAGPIPAPEILREYDDVYPGAAKIILDDFQKNSEHIRNKEKKQILGEIERDKRGQWMAFIVLMGILLTVLVSLYLGNVTFAGASGLVFLGISACSFIRRPGNQKKDTKGK